MKRRVSIFGSTGSIGQNTVDLINRNPDDYDVIALTGASNIQQLARDAIRLCADVAITADVSRLDDLRTALDGSGIDSEAGSSAINEAGHRPTDWVMSAIVGAAGLTPGLHALQQGATVALANKESLVCAGELMLQTARQNGAQLLPVDSEHSGVFQALAGEDISTVDRIIITASGGAFRDWPLEKLAHATLAQASSHPNWNMGQRITIDSASMFNKAMEIIETKEYFGISANKIEVLVHPESLIHALVGFNDGALIAHVGPTDMRHAIGYALHWPKRQPLPVERLDFARIGSFSFRAPDEKRWPALRLAREVMERGGLAGTVFNAAKEVALNGFVSGDISFINMAEIVDKVLNSVAVDHIDAPMTLDNIMYVDQISRNAAINQIKQRAG